MEYRYHVVECENIKNSGYKEYENCDFNLNFPGRSLVCGSIRLEGQVEIRSNADVNDGTKSVCFDHMVGANALISSCVTTVQNMGVIENATELPRFNKMITVGTNSRDDMNEARHVCEMRSCDDKVSEKVCMPRIPSDIGGAIRLDPAHGGSGQGDLAENASLAVDPDFSIKPLIALNSVAGANSLLGYSKSGEIKLSFNLARNLEVLYGKDAAANASYVVKNLEVCYTTVAEQAAAPLNLRSTMCLKTSINSRLSNHSARVPVVADSMSISFIKADREVSPHFQNTALEVVPNINSIKYMINDSTSSYISYELKNRLEILDYGIKSLSMGSHHAIRGDLLAANKGFIAGLAFDTPLDLTKQKVNWQIDSEASSSETYLAYQYFHSLLQL